MLLQLGNSLRCGAAGDTGCKFSWKEVQGMARYTPGKQRIYEYSQQIEKIARESYPQAMRLEQVNG